MNTYTLFAEVAILKVLHDILMIISAVRK